MYTEDEFLWIPEEGNLSELFFHESGRVFNIKHAIFQATKEQWSFAGTTPTWMQKEVRI